MHYRDLREFIAALEQRNQLKKLMSRLLFIWK